MKTKRNSSAQVAGPIEDTDSLTGVYKKYQRDISRLGGELGCIVYSRKALYDVFLRGNKAVAKLNEVGRRYFNERLRFLPMEVIIPSSEVGTWSRVPVVLCEGYYDEEDDYNFVELSFKYLQEKYAGEYLTY